jgi:gamma-glutamyl-gamma-aminobutyrate hydrolase PuuD
MNILIVPKIIVRYKNQFELSVEKKLIKFLEKFFPGHNIDVMNTLSIKKKYFLIILSGGNTILKFSKKKEDFFRSKFDEVAYKFSLKNNIKLLGICHGAHFLANKLNAIFKKNKAHNAKRHLISLQNNKKFNVNSYHNITVLKLNKQSKVLANAYDKSIEAFIEVKNKHVGIIWHPEREKKYRIQINLIKKFYATNSSGRG